MYWRRMLRIMMLFGFCCMAMYVMLFIYFALRLLHCSY